MMVPIYMPSPRDIFTSDWTVPSVSIVLTRHHRVNRCLVATIHRHNVDRCIIKPDSLRSDLFGTNLTNISSSKTVVHNPGSPTARLTCLGGCRGFRYRTGCVYAVFPVACGRRRAPLPSPSLPLAITTYLPGGLVPS